MKFQAIKKHKTGNWSINKPLNRKWSITPSLAEKLVDIPVTFYILWGVAG